MGHRICDTILDFCDPDQAKVKAILEELEIMLPGMQGNDSDCDSDGDSDGDSDNSEEDEKDGKKKKKGAQGKGKKKKNKAD